MELSLPVFRPKSVTAGIRTLQIKNYKLNFILKVISVGLDIKYKLVVRRILVVFILVLKLSLQMLKHVGLERIIVYQCISTIIALQIPLGF